jgi:hypothetical protein
MANSFGGGGGAETNEQNYGCKTEKKKKNLKACNGTITKNQKIFSELIIA